MGVPFLMKIVNSLSRSSSSLFVSGVGFFAGGAAGALGSGLGSGGSAEQLPVLCDHCKKPVWNNMPGFCSEACEDAADKLAQETGNAATTLAEQIAVEARWVPTWANMADPPSRGERTCGPCDPAAVY